MAWATNTMVPRITAVHVAYGSAALCVGLLHNVFLLFHVTMFVEVYHISQSAFWWSELLFLVWNSVNDFVVGWISDSFVLSVASSSGAEPQHSRVTASSINRRIDAIAYGGPAMALTFLLLWMPWASPGIQFTVCLCLYDACLTYIDVNHSALLADLAISTSERTDLSLFSSLFSSFACVSVFLSHAVWNGSDTTQFRSFCIILAAVSAAGFVLSAMLLRRSSLDSKKSDLPLTLDDVRSNKLGDGAGPNGFERVDGTGSIIRKASRRLPADHLVTDNGADISRVEIATANGTKTASASAPWYQFWTEMLASPNILRFATLELIQVFHCHFNSNFFPMFLTVLLGDHLSPSTQSVLLGLSFALPHFNNVFFSWQARKRGVYQVVYWLLCVKVALASGMLFAGPNSVVFLCVFVASNRVFTEGVCKLLNLVTSDLVDEDYVVWRRPQSISALIVGSTALLSKPGQTLAPVIGTWIIASFVHGFMFRTESIFGTVDHESSVGYDRGALRSVLFYMLVFVPLLCGCVQLVIWSKFTLHGAYLRKIKRMVLNGGKLIHTV